jgi:mannosyltransferase OCH1-like enzyme
MIPKTIINAWFGRGKKSPLFERCLASQASVSGWPVFEINEDTIDPAVLETPFYRGVLGRKEFVKATEYARLWGLWTHGGVYMDADVELLKPLIPLLGHEVFIGREDPLWINGAVIGAAQGSPVIRALLDSFPLQSDGMEKANEYGPKYLTKHLEGASGVAVLPPEYFYPYLWNQTPEQATITPNTYAMHHWAKSWL